MLVLLLGPMAAAPAQSAGRISADQIRATEVFTLVEGWERRSGTALETWTQIERTDALPSERGITEYRLTLHVDEALQGTTVGVFLDLLGAAALQVGGGDTLNFGMPGRETPQGITREEFGQRLQSFKLPYENPIELTLKFEQRSERFGWTSPEQGFRLSLGNERAMAQWVLDRTRRAATAQTIFVTGFLTQSVLHLIMFLYVPFFRSNAWFALNALLSAALAGLYFERVLSDDPATLQLAARLWNPLLFLTLLVLLRVTYEVYDRSLGRVFWSLAGLGLLLAGLTVAVPSLNAFTHFWWFHGLLLAETTRLNFEMVREGWRGSWQITAGIGALFVAIVWQFLQSLGIARAPFEMYPVAYLGVAALLLFTSAYLASKFAQVGQALRLQLTQVEELSAKTLEQELEAKEFELERRLLAADNLRKTDELHAARELQLSFLPRSLPEIPFLELAVAMETATEVGGDYYDFCLHEKGGLAAVIGDAAGHGARAGTMVSLMKGLFTSFQAGMDIPRFFAESNNTVREMELQGANTAMAIAFVEPGRLTFASAGIPPAIIYRKKDGSVEELLVEGMPLGALRNYPFQQKIAKLSPGDVILMMSDGLPERPAPSGEAFGYERIQARLAAVATGSAQEIVDRLIEAGEEWSEGAETPDDLTLLAMKVRDVSTADEDLAALRRFLPI